MNMRPWTRWQDWVAVVAGAYAALSPIWTETSDKASWTVVVLGVLTVAVALGSLASPGMVAAEIVTAALGVLLFVSPWVMGFHDINGVAWTAWITGVIVFLAGLAAYPESNRVHRGVIAQH
jgi:energy-converting hydrogenase Eha subunit G